MSAKEDVVLKITVDAGRGLQAIGEYQQGIDDLKAKQAQYREELDKGIIKKDAYRKAINETNQAIKYNTENIRILSKEIQNNVKQERAQEGSIDGMKAKLSNLTAEKFERMKKIYADGGYIGQLVDNVKSAYGYDMEITLRTDKSTDFKPLPKRWIVERTFSWLENFRRLAKDYEFSVKSSIAMIYIAFISLMLSKITN